MFNAAMLLCEVPPDIFSAPFPIGLPASTAFYLALYVGTLVIHVIFMNYVLAGAGYLAVASLFTGGPLRQRQKSASTAMLRDWLPFGISAAITAGVAPLLFIQILYREGFYTANLLLLHRWMAIVPVLIVGFYLAYLLKSRRIGGWPAWARLAVGGGVFACILFTAYSWTENHLLSTDRTAWPGFYGSRAILYRNAEAPARAAMWIIGAVPTMVTMLAWQLWSKSAGQSQLRESASHAAPSPAGKGPDGVAPPDGAVTVTPTPREIRFLSALAAAALVTAGLFALVYSRLLEPAAASALTSSAARPWLACAALGALLQLAAWHRTFHGRALTVLNLSLASLGVLFTLTGMTVAREIVRLARTDLTPLFPQHVEAAERGGFLVFVVCFLVNGALIAGCLRLVQTGAGSVHNASRAGGHR